MKLLKLNKTIFTFILFLIFGLVSKNEASAANCIVTPNTVSVESTQETFTISGAYYGSVTFSDLEAVGICVAGSLVCPNFPPSAAKEFKVFNDLGGGNIQVTIPNNGFWFIPLPGLKPEIKLYLRANGVISKFCDSVKVVYATLPQDCRIEIDPNPPQGGEEYDVTISDLPTGPDVTKLTLEWNIDDPNDGGWIPIQPLLTNQSTQTVHMDAEEADRTINFCVTATVNGATYNCVNGPFPGNTPCWTPFKVGGAPLPEGGTTGELGFTDVCRFSDDATARKNCTDCFLEENGVYTPFGCIKSDIQGFIEQILKIAISLAGGIAFIMIVVGGFTLMTSSGNPERLTSGKEIITSALAGLLLIVFSVVILRIIGVDILAIPGLSK